MDKQFNRYYTYIKPVIRNPQVKTYTSLIFSLVAIAVFSIFAIRPTLSTIVSLQKTKTEQEQTLKKLEEKSNNLLIGRTNLNNIDSQTSQKLQNLIPNSPSLTNVIENLVRLTNSRQATVSGIQFQPSDLEPPATNTTKANILTTVEFTFNTQGSYTQLAGILTDVKKLSRLIDVTSVTFNKSQDGDLIMSINAKAYYLK